MKKMSIHEMKKIKGGRVVDLLGCDGDLCCIKVSTAHSSSKTCGDISWYLSV